MRTTYTLVKNNDLRSYLINEKKEQIQSIERATRLIIGISGDYRAALGFLKENKIETRLDYSRVELDGVPVLSELQEIRTYLESELYELEHSKKQ